MASKQVQAPSDDVASFVASLNTSIPCSTEARIAYISSTSSWLKRGDRLAAASIDDIILYLKQEARRLSDVPQMGELSPAILLAAIVSELARSPSVLKDASDLLWECADKPSFNLSTIPLLNAVFTRVATLGPSDAFGGVVERLVKTFSDKDALAKKRLAVSLVAPLAQRHPNLFLNRLQTCFAGLWAVSRDMLEFDAGKGMPTLGEAFAVACGLLKRVPNAFPALPAEQLEKLKTALKSRRDAEVIVGITFMDSILSLRSGSNIPLYSELWALVDPLRKKDNIKYHALDAVVTLARYDPHSFTIDRRSDSEKKDKNAPSSSHRSQLLKDVDDLWKADMSLSASQRIIDFYLKLIAVPFPKDTVFSTLQVEAYFLTPVQFKLISKSKKNNSDGKSLEGCWDILTLLSTICRNFPLSQTIMDAKVAPCIIAMLEWGQLAPNLSETLPAMIRLMSPKRADTVLALLLDMVSKVLCGRPFKPVSETITAPQAQKSSSALSQAITSITKLNPAALFQTGPAQDVASDAFAAANKIVVALQTLATFGIGESDVMGDFIVQTLLPLLNHSSAAVRVAVVRTVQVLAVPLPTRRLHYAEQLDAGSSPRQASGSVLSSPTSAVDRSFKIAGPTSDGGIDTQTEDSEISASRRSILQRVIGELLSAATTDPDNDVRLACLTAITNTFLRHMTESSSIRLVFHAMVDNNLEVRMVAHRLLCLLEPMHQALVAPAMRRTLVSAFNRFAIIKSTSPEDAVNLAEVLATMFKHCGRLARVYFENVLVVCRQHASNLVPPVPNENLALALLKCMCSIAVHAGPEIESGDVEFMLDVVTHLHADNVSSKLRCLALNLSSELVLHTRLDLRSAKNVSNAYKRAIPIQRILQDSDSPAELRVAALKYLGTAGAVDPNTVQRLLEVADVDSLQAKGHAALPPDTHTAACDLLVSSLAQMLSTQVGSPQLLDTLRHQLRTLMMLMDGCRAADSSLRHIIPSLVEVLHWQLADTVPTAQPQSIFFTTMYQLIRAVAVSFDFREAAQNERSVDATSDDEHVLSASCFSRIRDLVLDLWSREPCQSPQYSCRMFALGLTSVIVSYHAANTAFSVYFRTLVPVFLDPNISPSVSECFAPITILFLSKSCRHLNQFRTFIVNWVAVLFSRPSLSPKVVREVLQFLRILSSSGVYLREYAPSVLRAITSILPRIAAEMDVVEEAFWLLAELVKQFMMDLGPFVDAIPRELLARDTPAVNGFRRLWSAIRTSRRGTAIRQRFKEIETTLSHSDIQALHRDFTVRTHAVLKQTLTWGQSESAAFVPQHEATSADMDAFMHVSQQQAIAAVANAPASRPEYLQRFVASFVEHSPYQALRCIYEPRSDASVPLVRAVFFAAFRAAWRRSSPLLKSKLSGAIEALLDMQIQDDQALLLLSVAEHMKMAGDPLEISVQALSRAALRIEAVAKALHWKEESFRQQLASATPDPAALAVHAEELILLYGKVNSSSSAIGLLTRLNLPEDVKKRVQEESLINLKRYAEALEVQKRPEVRNRSISLSRNDASRIVPHHGRNRSGSDFSDSSFAGAGTALGEGHSRMKCHFMLGQLDAVLMVPIPGESTDDAETARSMVRLASEAAVSLGRWDTVDRMLKSPHAASESVSHCICACALAIHRKRFDEALTLVDRGRQLLVAEVGSLLSESYQRAYESLVVAQQLSELEETISVLTLPQGVLRSAASERLHEVWSRRLDLLARDDVPSWRKIFSTRSLLIPSSRDVSDRLRLAQLCAENNMPQLRFACLSETVDHPLTVRDLNRPDLHPELALNFADYLLQEAKLPDRDAECEVLDRMINSYSQDPKANRVVAKLCGMRASRERDHMSDLAIELAERATRLDQTSAAVWRDWAVLNTRLLENGFDARSFDNAVQSFVTSVCLSGTAQEAVQDILLVLALWSTHVNRTAAVESLRKHLPKIPCAAWLRVIPQLVAKIDFGPETACMLASDIIKSVFKFNPQALIFPLLLTASSDGRRGLLGRHLLLQLTAERPELVSHGQVVCRELCRVAKEPWIGAIFAAWEMYTAYCNEPSRAQRLRLVAHLEAFHAATRDATSTAESAFAFRNATALRTACREIKAWASAPHNDAALHAAFQLYESMYRNPANKVQSRTLELQYWSPKLFAAASLEIAIPTHECQRDDGQPNLIHGFDNVVGIISSKQAPRKIQIVGNGGEKHNFLLKGGEDLRLDERVMQLFDLVNTLLSARHNPSVLRALNIQRYCVTPISSTVGLCGWVDACDTLHELISTDRDSHGVPRATGLEFVLRAHILPGDPTSPGFNHDCTKLSIMQQVEVFEYVCDATSGDDLRRAMWSRGSANSEQWLQKRLLYMQSLAVMSMAGYVLGLGDRHVTNIMIQRTSGKVVHIDFGDCFEVAMNRASIPEKVPFRLTRMLCNAMDVAQIEGHFRATSEHVMKVLRDNRGSVLAMLEAFVDDPLVQWRIVNQQRDSTTKTVDHEQHDGETERLAAPATPKSGEFVEVDAVEVCEALDLFNRTRGDGDADVAAAAAELESSSEAFNVMRRIKAKLRGKDFGQRKLDHKQQVSRLIKEATSVTNLAQAWVGWHPWW